MRPTEHLRETALRALGSRGGRVFLAAAGTLLLLGTILRVLGYFGGIELWWDEAMWAMFIAEDTTTSLRPPGYVWISRWLIDLRNTEPVIRSPSLLAGVLSLPVLLAMCRRAGLSRLASLFGLFVLAVHPAAIDLTKEFKPYALALLLHLLLLWQAFSFLRSPQTWRLVVMNLTAMVAAWFSWSVVVLYPGLFATVALSALRRRRVSQLWASLGGAAATLGVLLVAYAGHGRGRDPDAAYWGGKYDIFYLGSDLPGRAAWLVEKTYDVASFPAQLVTFWLDRSAVDVVAALQAGLCLLGVTAIVTTRRWDWAGLWLSPWLVTVALNLLGLWPYGVFRTNLFLLAYGLLVGLAGLDGLRRWVAVRPAATRLKGHLLVPVFCGAFVLAFLPLDLGYFAESKGSGMAGNCYVHRAFEEVYEAEHDQPPPAKRRRFVVNDHAYDAYRYYREFHVVAREKYQGFLRERYRRSRRYQPLKEAIDLQAERGFWLLACQPGPSGSLRQYVLDRCPQVDHLHDFRDGSLLLRCRGIADRLQ
jgi:hypothetical protein